ncbi:hypothetical protein Gohar_000798, partial [Gossypium harknessii]|nr:hypothetical protein [Gossypium laxum]MBA0816101.1 hypothetical protein [Gossypium harknessii]
MFQKFNFDTEWAVKLISKITNDEDIPIEGDAIVKQLLALQINAEKYFFNIRKSLVEFDEVLEVQRKHVYDLRQLILTGDDESCSQHIFQYMQAVVDEIVFGNADPLKHPRYWSLSKLLKEFINIAGKLLDDSFAMISEEDLFQSLKQLHESNSVDVDNFHLPNLPKPPDGFRGIRRKNSSLKRWLAICSDDSTKNGRYRPTTNLLRKYLGDILIASYLNIVQESGYDDAYIKEIERAVLVKTLDCFWRDHLVNMNRLSSACNTKVNCRITLALLVITYGIPRAIFFMKADVGQAKHNVSPQGCGYSFSSKEQGSLCLYQYNKAVVWANKFHTDFE